MKEISNQSLAILLLFAVILSLGGAFVSINKLNRIVKFPSITGFSGTNTSTASVNLTISDITEINFTQANITWGSGFVVAGSSVCQLNTETDNINCSGFNTITTPLTIQNIGNNDVRLNLTFSANSTDFPGGDATYASLKFKMSNNSDGGCGHDLRYTNYEEMNTTPLWNQTVCEKFDFEANTDKVDIDINITIPDDAGKQDYNVTITATGITV